MKILILTALLISSIQGKDKFDLSLSMQKQCQYEVYGNGQSIDLIAGILYGAGQIARYKAQKHNKLSLYVITTKACQDALNDNSLIDFELKYYKALAEILK